MAPRTAMPDESGEQLHPASVPVRRPDKRGILPPEIVSLVVPAAKIGTYTGGVGAFAGVARSVIADVNPLTGGIIAGFQWFCLGSSYHFTRNVIARSWGGEEIMLPTDKTKLSAVAGTTAGSVAGLLRGPRNILPSMIVFGLLGAGGQMTSNYFASRQPKLQNEDDSVFRSKWSPLKKLTDEEYARTMEERVLQVRVEIALVDDRIAELRAAEAKEREPRG